MKEVTAILLILIAVIGIISIIIVKLYYREKEKDNDKEKLEEFINSTRSEYDEEKRRRVRRSPNRPRANLSEAQLYANTIDDVENGEMGSTTALLRQRAKSMEEAPKKKSEGIINRYMLGEILVSSIYSLLLCLLFLKFHFLLNHNFVHLYFLFYLYYFEVYIYLDYSLF